MAKLNLKNIGIISEASIEVGNLTVLTGYNDSGKSTIGKVLFALIKTANNAPDEYQNYRMQILRSQVLNLLNSLRSIDKRKKGWELIQHLQNETDELEQLWMPYLSNHDIINTEYHIQLLSKIEHIESIINSSAWKKQRNAPLIKELISWFDSLKVSIRSSESAQATSYDWMMDSYIQTLFAGRIQTADKFDSSIAFSQDEDSFQFNLKKENSKLEGNISFVNQRYQDITVIDSPSIIQLQTLFRDRRFRAERYELTDRSILEYPLYRDLVAKITSGNEVGGFFDDPFSTMIRNEFGEKIAHRISGKLRFDKANDEIMFEKELDGKKTLSLPPVNVASGIKALGLLELLMNNGLVNPFHVLVIDEPESHLHPQWEVFYGKILVELAIKGVPIIVSTHSGTVLEAIMRASEKLDAEGYVSYYVGEKSDKGGVVFHDVTDHKADAFSKISQANRDMFLNLVDEW